MGKRKAALAGRAWKLRRLALLWAKKSGVFRRGLLSGLRLVPSYIKSLRAARSDMIRFAEREFSFDETPIFRLNLRRPGSMRMPCIPCINAPVDFDGGDDVLFGRDGRRSCGRCSEAEEKEEEEEEEYLVTGGSENLAHEADREDEESIDVKAEVFIAKFYERMKLQRQISLLQYSEMLLRSSS